MAVMNQVLEPTMAERHSVAEQIVVGMAMGYSASQILFNAVELGIFELLQEQAQPLDALSRATGIGPDPLERLLIGCCSLGLLHRSGNVFALTEMSRACLLKSQPGYVGGLFPFLKRGLYPVWEHLDSGLREGKPQWEKVPAIGKAGLFEALYRNEAALQEFHSATYQLSYLTGLAACQSFPFARFRTVVDLGGGTGGFAAALCQCFPDISATVYDLPMLEPAARDIITRSGLADRIKFQGGNFFEDPLPTADLYVLGDILHDWNEAEGTWLLEKVSKALTPSGAICIVESLLNDEKDGPRLAAFMNLTMLVSGKGRHHSPVEFERWLKPLGFASFEYRRLPAPRDIFIGWKA